MANKIGLTLVTAGCLLAAIVLFVAGASSAAQARTGTSTEFSAQQQQENKGQRKKAAPAARPAPQRAAPQRAAPQRTAPQRAAPQRSAPREVTPRRTQQRVVTPQKTAPRMVTPRRTAPSTVTRQKAAPRMVRQPKSTPKVVAPTAAGRKATSRTAAPRVVTPRGTRAVTASRLRGVPARAPAALSSGAKLLGVAQWVPRTSWQRLADVCRARRLGRNRNRLKSILPLRLHFGARALLRRADRRRLPADVAGGRDDRGRRYKSMRGVLSVAVSSRNALNVRYWHKADMPSGTAHVRFWG